ncbi:hypothetical protein BGW80DRAFT_1253047 [Lactifluus volemus]|nr:hypothetical protein BGW80DRAFT_1253047 [Lactifluus volemus]
MARATAPTFQQALPYSRMVPGACTRANASHSRLRSKALIFFKTSLDTRADRKSPNSSLESRSMRVDAGHSPLKYASPHRSPLSPSRRILETPRKRRISSSTSTENTTVSTTTTTTITVPSAATPNMASILTTAPSIPSSSPKMVPSSPVQRAASPTPAKRTGFEAFAAAASPFASAAARAHSPVQRSGSPGPGGSPRSNPFVSYAAGARVVPQRRILSEGSPSTGHPKSPGDENEDTVVDMSHTQEDSSCVEPIPEPKSTSHHIISRYEHIRSVEPSTINAEFEIDPMANAGVPFAFDEVNAMGTTATSARSAVMELAHRVASESPPHGNDDSEGGASTSVDCKSVSAAAVEKINEKAAEMHRQRSRRKPGRRADGIDGELSNASLSLL